MKAPYGKMKIGVLAAAVQGAVLAMCSMPAYAQETVIADATSPDNFVEIGAANLSHDSNKFGEYSGMNDKGAYAIGNFSVKGGDGYGPGEGTTRWSVSGSNLGLDSRELKGSFSKQGQWNLGIGYDELQHNTTSRYQTPYLGSMGGSNFTLPAGFGLLVAPPAVPNVNAMNSTQLSAFHTVDVNNTRKNTSFNAGYILSPEWKATFDYNNLKQDGAKLMGFASDGNIGAAAERVSILPNPTNYTTETVNIALDWTGDKGYLTAGYFGSFFRNHDDRVTFTTWQTINATDTMSVPPDNKLHQFNLSGGYKFSPTTKLTGAFSYGRNTQDDNYVASAASIVSIPRTSLNGEVITTHADLKLVDQTTKDLKLSGGVIYNKRDNQTDSGTYNTKHLGGTAVPLPNAPFSFDKTQVELAADYRLGKNNKIRVAYNHDDMDRYCNQYADSAAFPAGTGCLVNTQTKEDRLSVVYKLKAAEGVDFSATYAYSDRNTDYNTLARVPMRPQANKGNVLPSGLTTGPAAGGLNGGDYLGFHPIYDASREQNMLKLSVNWEANDKLSLGLSGRYADDNYTENTFGAQDGKSWNANLDATYNYAENGSVFGYVSQDYRDRYIKHSNRSAVATGYFWGDQLEDKATTYGLGFKQGGLLGGNLDIKGDLTYSDAKTSYSSDFLNFFGGATTAVTCAGPTQLTCGSAPDVKNKLTQIKLSGTYKVDKQSKIAVGYLYQKLETHDYYYNAYQYGYTSTSVLPTNQNSGDYSVNVVAVSYIYSFK